MGVHQICEPPVQAGNVLFEERLVVSVTLPIASNTGWTSLGDDEMTFRISGVAPCCSAASASEFLWRSISACTSAYGAPPPATRGLPHCPQNFWLAGFSCWHRGPFIHASARG